MEIGGNRKCNVRRLLLEVSLEELNAFAAEVGCFAGAVVCSGDHEEGEVLIGLDEVVHHLIGGRGVDVAVHFSDGEHELAGEFGDVGAIGIFDIGVVEGPIEPLLVPPHLVDAVVVAAAIRDGNFVEVTVVQEGGGGRLTTGGAAVDTDA